jgi:lysophospholipase L1-like esterase
MRRILSVLSVCFLASAVLPAGPLGKFVVVGDSLTAGFQNFSLYTSETNPNLPPGGNQHGYAELIAKQAGTDLLNPIVLYPGLPPALTINSVGQIDRASGFGLRLNILTQTLNLSVPSYTVADALGRQADAAQVLINPLGANPQDILELAVLGPPVYCGAIGLPLLKVTLSSVNCAVQLHPDTIMVSLGNNDALQQLTFGAPPTAPSAFGDSYHKVITKLKSTHARIMLVNIPDVTRIPFLVPAAVFNANCNANITGYAVPNIITPNPNVPVGDICQNYQVRSAQDVQAASDTIKAYNEKIQAELSGTNVILFDLNALFADVIANGYKIGDKTLTARPLGGLFSLDGIHPTNTGYGIMANAAIKAMNSGWRLPVTIPSIDLNPIVSTDPLVGLPSPPLL